MKMNKDTFLYQVTRDLLRVIPLQEMQQYTLVFPMQRAGLFVKQYLADYLREQHITTPVVLPHFTTIDSLSDTLSALRPDEEITSVFRLYHAYQQYSGQATLSIDAFYSWGVQLLTDFSNADMALMDVEKMMQTTSEAGLLDMLQLDDETRSRLEDLLSREGSPTSVRRYFTTLWQALPDIYREFRRREDELGIGTRGARSRWVIEHWGEAQIEHQLAQRHYVFIGFNYLLAAERRLMALIQERDREHTRFYWDYDPDFSIPNGIYGFLEENIHQFGNHLPDSPACDPPAIRAIACQSSAGQAQYVHDWLLKHHRAGDKTAVVVADESLLQMVVASLPDSKGENDPLSRINITKGYPLRMTRIYAELLRRMDLWDMSDTHTSALLPTLSTDLEQDYRRLGSSEDTPWLHTLNAESYYQTQRILRRMNQLLATDTEAAQCIRNAAMLRSLLRRQMEAVNIPFHGEPLTDIQVIGVLETRLLDFDHVLILNVEEGTVPNTAADRSFLPLDLRRAYHMQTREEESKIYGYNFFRLLRRAQDVTLTFSEASTAMEKKTMSRFLMQLLTSPDYTVLRSRLTESDCRSTLSLQTTAYQPDNGRDHVPTHLSPSSIARYIECPRWFYLTHVHGLHEAEDDSVMLPPNVLGTLLHNAMEQAYLSIAKIDDISERDRVLPVEIQAADIKAFLRQPDALQTALMRAYTMLNDSYRHKHEDCDQDHYPTEQHTAENHALCEMMQKILTYDCDHTPFTLVWMEHPIDMDVHTPHGSVRVMGTIDRLDITGQGAERTIRIVDYKTGGYDEKKMQLADCCEPLSNHKLSYALQTLIYSEMVSRRSDQAPLSDNNLPISPELFYPRAMSQDKRFSLNKMPVTDYRTQCATDFVTGLESKVDEIMAHFSPDGDPVFPPADAEICQDKHSYCPFHLLCAREKKE